MRLTRRHFLKISGMITGWFLVGFRSALLFANALKKRFLDRIEAAYQQDLQTAFRKPQDNPAVQALYAEFLGSPLGEKSLALLHTAYVDRSSALAGIRPPLIQQTSPPFQLSVHPNPANGRCTIQVDLSKEASCWIALFNLTGQRVRTFASGRFPSGTHRWTWDGKDDQGRPIASGRYLLRVISGNAVRTRLLIWTT